MKNLKFVVASLLLVAGGIFASSFATKSFNKNAFSLWCFYYNPSTTSNKDAVGADRNLLQAQVVNANFWIQFTSPAECLDGQFLCTICFNLKEGNPPVGDYTLQEAIDLVWACYGALSGLPHNADIDPGVKVLNVYREISVDNH